MKIFISYSRGDAEDFADQIQRHLSSFKYDIFANIDSISPGEIWNNTLTTNISSCDIFVVIVTHGAFQSPHVENEVLRAKRERKIIIPCFFRDISSNKIKWGLEHLQGVEFDDKYELARNLYSKINIIQPLKPTSFPISKTSENYKQEREMPTLQRREHIGASISLKIIIPIIVVLIPILFVIVFVNPFGTYTSSDNIVSETLPPNSPPIALDKSVTALFNTPLSIALETNDENVDDELTATIVTQPQHGILGEIDQTSKTVTYTPNQGFVGTDTFIYKANDGNADSNSVVVAVIVNGPVNAAPITSDKSVTTSSGTAVDLILEATDVNIGDELTASIVTQPENGTLGEINQTNGIVAYTPSQDFVGNDKFTYKVNDGTADSNNAVVTVTVNAPP